MKLRFPVGGESLGCCCSEKLGGWDARPAKYFVIKKFSDFSCRAVVRVLLAYVTQPGKGIFRHQEKLVGWKNVNAVVSYFELVELER